MNSFELEAAIAKLSMKHHHWFRMHLHNIVAPDFAITDHTAQKLTKEATHEQRELAYKRLCEMFYDRP